MTKLKIFIDFEAISSPFNREFKLKREFPYAYSLGVYTGKKFKTKTFIFNFNKQNPEDINEILRSQILYDIRSIIDNKKFQIKRDSAEFISYAPGLEKKVLNSVYKGVNLKDISKGAMISLSMATDKYIQADNYFPFFKKWVKKHIPTNFIEKRGLIHDGALAALAGYILVANSKSGEAKWYPHKIDIKLLLKELHEYSVDDVKRMQYIYENMEEFFKDAADRKEYIIQRNKINSNIHQKQRLKDMLIKEDQNITIGDFIKSLDDNIQEMTSEINILKDKEEK